MWRDIRWVVETEWTCKNPDPLYDAVLVFLNVSAEQRETPQARATWLTLWQEHFAGEKMATTDVEIAAMMTCVGVWREVRDGDYTTALRYLDAFFAHPQRKFAGPFFLMELRCDCMISLFHLGRETEAIATRRSLLADQKPSNKRLALVILRDRLYVYLLQAEPELPASVEMTEFVWEVAQAHNFRKHGLLPSPATFAQLCKALNQSWPVAVRQQVLEANTEKAQQQKRRWKLSVRREQEGSIITRET